MKRYPIQIGANRPDPPTSRRQSSIPRAPLLFPAFVAMLAALLLLSPAVADTGTEVPAKPTGLSVVTTLDSLEVDADWDDVDGAEDYLVRWRLYGPNQELNDGVRTTSSDEQFSVDDYGEWVVRVQACNDAGCGKPLAQRFSVESAPESKSKSEQTSETKPEPSTATQPVTKEQRQQITATANAGPDQEVRTGATVTLDGSGSSSTISDATLTYGWTQSAGVNVTLDDATAQMPSFTAPSVRTDLEFVLVVNDGTHASVPDTVSVRVRPPLNPTSAPCVHPSGATQNFYAPGLIEITNITDGGFSIRGKLAIDIYDFHLCWPDGTVGTLATGLSSTDTHTETGLSSSTRYWWAARSNDSGSISWSEWQAITTTGPASVRGARFTSSPASGDTYKIGETIQAEVTWSQPVTVDNGGRNRNVSLRLDVGTDDSDLSNSRRKMAWTGEGSGTDTLTFEYMVGFGGTDTDSDGIWLQTLSSTHDRMVFLENGATLTGGNPDTNTAFRSRAGLPTTGDSERKVDDTTTATADAGPDQEALFGTAVNLDGSAASARAGPTFTYAWTQTGGVDVTLDNATARMPSFTAPSVRTDLEFVLVVNDGTNASNGDRVSVAVRPPFNPTSAPCAHPAETTEIFYSPSLIEITNITDGGFSIRGKLAIDTYDFHLCWPDGTVETLATGLSSTDTHTKTGLSSSTRYWWAARSNDSGSISWSEWQAITTTGPASVRGARFTSSPPRDDTYLVGETIHAQVTWSKAVTVDNGGNNSNVSLRLDLGTDDSNLSNSRRRMTWTGEGSGTDTLTFEYTVQRYDVDTDGIWLQTLSSTHDRMVFLENGATLTGGDPATSTAFRSRSGLPTSGNAKHKVDVGRMLVGNNEQTHGPVSVDLTGDIAQQFTTGDDGYKLAYVDIRLSSTASTPLTYSVSVHENSGSGTSSRPAGRMAMLQKPARALGSVGLYSFSAPVGGIDLRANTSYWVVIDVIAGTNESVVHTVQGDEEDPGGVEGWSIGNDSLLRQNTETVWTPNAFYAVRLNVRGFSKPKAATELMRFVSAPTYDSNSDGVRDTYVEGDKVLVYVEFNEPVVVSGAEPHLRLNLGTDGSGATETMGLESVLHGGMTLRFAYTVASGDADADGLWVETDSGQLLFGPGSATAVKSVATGASASRNKVGLPGTGNELAKVDGSKTSSDRGPVPTGATVNGETLTVTYDRSLNTSVDTATLPSYFSVQGAGSVGVGNRNAYQHPSVVSVTGDSNEKLQLTLSDPARGGDKVWLTYELRSHVGPVKGSGDSGKVAPAFVDLAVTNNTPGPAGPEPWFATVKGSKLTLVFDEALDGDSVPEGSAFKVLTDDLDDDRRAIPGTGTASVSGTKVTVTLKEAVRAKELAGVYYTKPSSNPLRNAGQTAEVKSFEGFRVESVNDGLAPAYLFGEAQQTRFTSGSEMSKVVLYFNEPLDVSSVPAISNFVVTVGTNSAVNPSSVSIVANAAVLALDSAIASGTTVQVSYTRGSRPILDLSENAVATFSQAKSLTASGAGTPTLQSASVAGARLSLTYDRPLNPGKEPAPERYTLNYPLATGETDDDLVKYVNVVAVSVQGKSAVLQLEHPVYPCAGAAPFTATYTKPSGATPNLQNLRGIQADAFSKQSVTNARNGWCTNGVVTVPSDGHPQGFVRSSPRPKSVTLKFKRKLDTTRALSPGAFSLEGTPGASAPSVKSAAYTDDASGVVLTLDRAVAPGEEFTVAYTRPKGEPGLWNTDGQQIADFSGVPVPPAQGVIGVEVISDAGDDNTYGLGESIRIAVTFSEAVAVKGAPRLMIDMDPAEWGSKWADYESGSGTTRLVFAYEVVEPNLSTLGIAVLSDTLEANGGAIKSSATEVDANLAHDGLDHDPAHQVDWRLGPSVTGVAVSSRPADGDTYALGETVRVRVTFSEAVVVTGSPRLKIDMDPAYWGDKWAVYESGSGTTELVFTYQVVEPNLSTQGIAVLANTLQANGGAIKSAATEVDANLPHDGLDHDPAHKVDWR